MKSIRELIDKQDSINRSNWVFYGVVSMNMWNVVRDKLGYNSAAILKSNLQIAIEQK